MKTVQPSRPLQVALLGDGVMAGIHARVLARLGTPVSLVVGVSSDRASRFAREHSISRWSTDLDLLVADQDVCATVIASPNQFHTAQAEALLRAGKHVLCEVPMATSLADACRLARTVESATAECMVAQTTRFLPALVELRRRVVTGEAHPLQVVSIRGLLRRGHENIGMDGRPRDWADSILWHHGSYAVDTALWLLDDQVQLARVSVGPPDPDNGQPLDVSVTLETAAGLMATLVLSYSSRSPINELVLIAREGTHRVVDMVARDTPESLSSRPSEGALTSAVVAQDKVFLGVAAGTERPRPVPAELLTTFHVLEDIERQLGAPKPAERVRS